MFLALNSPHFTLPTSSLSLPNLTSSSLHKDRHTILYRNIKIVISYKINYFSQETTRESTNLILYIYILYDVVISSYHATWKLYCVYTQYIITKKIVVNIVIK